jgi:iron-sulfur cluster repair protein YtfE (RIC family)
MPKPKRSRSQRQELDRGQAGIRRDPADWMSEDVTVPDELNEPEESELGEANIMRDPGEGLSQSALDMIRADHERLTELFAQRQTGSAPSADAHTLSEQVCVELEIHSRVEEEIFYPAVRALADADTREFIDQSLEDHAFQERIITQLRGVPEQSPEYEDILNGLAEDVAVHIEQEESMLLPVAEELLGDSLVELGEEMLELKEQLIASGESQFPGAAGRLSVRRGGGRGEE